MTDKPTIAVVPFTDGTDCVVITAVVNRADARWMIDVLEEALAEDEEGNDDWFDNWVMAIAQAQDVLA